MKKLLFSALLLSGGIFSVNAQLADGTPAPNFTATDLNGNTHTLSDYLSQGKTVILDISATWCGPCWSYHSSHALRDFYLSYGPDGSDEVMVFFIEGDNATSIADLNGTGSNTQGNWVEGTPYPIINSGAIANQYQISYFPTLYRICPDGLAYEINSLTAAQLRSNVNTNCGSLQGVTNHALIEGDAVNICSPTDQQVLTAKIKNYAQGQTISSATVVLKENGNQISSAPYSGNLAQWAEGTVSFPSAVYNPNSNYTVQLTNINSNTPVSPSWMLNDNADVTLASLTGQAVVVKCYTDNYPGEISWSIKNSAGTTVASGGPYQAGTGTAGAGGPDANTTKTHNVTLPSASDCYSIHLADSYGDGWTYGSTQHGLEVLYFGGSVAYVEAGGFGSSKVQEAALRTDPSVNIDENMIEALSIYPNPASDELNVAFEANGDYVIAILDLQGRMVATQTLTGLTGSQTVKFPVSDLAKGSYIVKISTEGVSQTQNVVIR